MPQLGESVAEGTIGKWLKKPGDHVDKYEPIVEVITDKVNAEVPSPFEGTLTEILVQEGETVPNNTEIAVIEGAGAERRRSAPRLRRSKRPAGPVAALRLRRPSARTAPGRAQVAPTRALRARSNNRSHSPQWLPRRSRAASGRDGRGRAVDLEHQRQRQRPCRRQRHVQRANNTGCSALGPRARRRSGDGRGHRPQRPRHARRRA